MTQGSGFTLSGLVEAVLGALFGVAAAQDPPALVHPVLGRVENRLAYLWPTGQRDGQPPARLLTPAGLRTFLLGAGADSQTLGKLDVLGLPADPLQQAWSGDGTAIGGLELRIAEDGAAPPTRLEPGGSVTLTLSAVKALWSLGPDSGAEGVAAASAAYADLLAAALVGRPRAGDLAQARTYLAATASSWLTALLALVALKVAQQAGTGDPDPEPAIDRVVAAYNALRTDRPGHLADDFLGGHPATRPMPEKTASVGGGRVDDVLRSALRHTAAGSPVAEPGTSKDTPVSGPAPDVDSTVVEAALKLAAQAPQYTTDTSRRFDDGFGDSSSFVQRALAAAGLTAFEPTEGVRLTSYDIVARDDLFQTMRRSSARAGDVLVQGGFAVVDGAVTWVGHCGILVGESASRPGLSDGISLDARGPTLAGLWGAPGGSYGFAANLLVRRPRVVRRGGDGAGGLPLVPFTAADPAAEVVNEAKVFSAVPFDPAAPGVRWTSGEAEAQLALRATRLGLRCTVRPGHTPELVLLRSGPMVCRPVGVPGSDGYEQQLQVYLAAGEVARLRARDPVTGEFLDIDDARLVYTMESGAAARALQRLQNYRDDGQVRPVQVSGLDGPRAKRVWNVNVRADLGTAERMRLWWEGDQSVLWQSADGVAPADLPLVRLLYGETVAVHAEVSARAGNEGPPVWYRINAGFVLDRLRTDGRRLDAEYALLTEGYTEARVASGVAGGVPVPDWADLRVVWGGSRASLVLQPYDVVPAALFSYATCDPVEIFAPALSGPSSGDQPLTVTSSLPTLSRAVVQQLWTAHTVTQESFVADADEEFPAIDYRHQVVGPPNTEFRRNRGFYDALAAAVTYGPSGRNGGLIHGTGVRRTLVPHADPGSRPPHPVWTAARSLQLRRLFPLLLLIRFGAGPDRPEIGITQDDRDCIRQEYVCHLKFTDAYYQQFPGFGAAKVLPTTVVGHRDEVEYNAAGAPVRPGLIGKQETILVPRRSDLRPFPPGGLSSRELMVEGLTYSYTRLIDTAEERIDTVQQGARAFALTVASFLQAARNGAPMPGGAAPPYLWPLVRRVTGLLRGPAPQTGSLDWFIRAQLLNAEVVDRFAQTTGTVLTPKPLTVIPTSGWRPPEFNEAVSSAAASNHQLGLATDLQPKGAGTNTTRNPLAQLCVHEVAQRLYRGGYLTECLLENSRTEECVGLFLADKIDFTVNEYVDGANPPSYVLRGAGIDEPLSDGQLMGPGGAAQKFALDVKLARAFRKAFDKSVQGLPTSYPWPTPTYLDMYLFALCDSSHVHHTWNPRA
ncbi:hypothetical protein [Streptomyces sp. NPDC057199]|uniref:hypothetical protein n=1 Tax=Streptomyces sp. NPDC057199 TaxID=3346047 RepID=UPI003644114F